MKAHVIEPDDENWPHNYEINATHKWRLPGVECPQCGFVGGCVGLHYPTHSLPEGVDPKPYTEGWPVTPERQVELQAPLLRAWGDGVKLRPGTEFGPLVGKAWGDCGDVGWVNSWTMLLASSSVERLRQFGVPSLDLAPTEIKWRSKKVPEYLELQIRPDLRLTSYYLHQLGIRSQCSKCGLPQCKKDLADRVTRLAYAELGNNPVLDATSLPAQWDLLRIAEWPGLIVASERFKEAASKIGMSNATFREIQVAGSNGS